MNLDNTMAVTQNFMDSVNFDKVWRSVRKERKKWSCRFLKKLKTTHPELYQRATLLNEQDGFIMYDQRKAIEKRHSEYPMDDELEKKRKTDSTTSSTSSSSSSSSSSTSRSESEN